MNPDQPSREQIEARLTALLFGELPAEEAELLRWTISRDPELQRLHDQLKGTIGFVREAMKNPTGAPMDAGTPLKLPKERRQTLLAHFKTARPQPPQKSELSWLRRLKVSPLIPTLVVIAIIALLAAVLLPVLSTSKMRSLNEVSYLGKSESTAGIHNSYQSRGTYGVSGPQVTTLPAAKTPPTPAPIALPNTEPAQAESDKETGQVYSQNVVGYVNISPPAALPPPQRIARGSAGGNREPVVAGSNFPDAGLAGADQVNTASWNLQAQNKSLSDAERAANGPYEQKEFQNGVLATNYLANAMPMDQAALTTREIQNVNNGTVSFGDSSTVPPASTSPVLGLPTAPVPELPRDTTFQSSPFANRLQNALNDTTNGTLSAVQYFNFPDEPGSGYVTNTVAMNQASSWAWSANALHLKVGNIGLADGDRNVGTSPNPPIPVTVPPAGLENTSAVPLLAPPPVHAARVGLSPRAQFQYQFRAWNPVSNEVQAANGPLTPPQSQQFDNGLVGTRRDKATSELEDQLDDQIDLHKLLSEKIEADRADASMPKSALVTVVSSAQPGVSQNLWQRMTGQVESQASIKIEPDVTSSGPIGYASYDPYYMETELNTIRGNVVLGKVVDSLKLDQAWSKKADGEKLSRHDAIAQLRSRLDLQSERNSKLIDIGAKSDNPEEAAKLANAVAEAYQQYRLEVHSNEMVAGIQHLQQMYVDEDKKIRELQAGLAGRNISLNESHGTREAAVTKVTKDKSDVWRAPQPTTPIPQPEIRTTDNGFSTFSLNVSDVSFKLAMASLEKGQMPAPASIRSEEFINAFDYHDPEPLQGEPLAFVSERASDPFAQERDMLRFSIKAAAAGRQDGRQLNLVLLLDTSGSMERADRVAIIREALRVLAGQLQPHDVVSVVTFARTARLWAEGVHGDKAGATFDKVGSITPEGGTNLEEAMRLAYETALRHFIAGGMNRVVLMTDGAANLGNVDPEALTQKVDSERRQGIALDCFGIGWDDYNDDLLEQLSSNGDGRYAFINSPDEVRTEFAAKLAGALQVAAEDVKVQVEFNPNRVTSWRQIGYAKHQLTKQQFRDNAVAAGAIASREAGNALYTIEPRADGEGPIATVRVRYRVPGTQDVHERSWLVEYTGAAPELTQSSPAMRLAVTAAETSEWLANSPFAQDVTPDELLNDLSGVPQIYGTDERPKQLEWMIREADTLKR